MDRKAVLIKQTPSRNIREESGKGNDAWGTWCFRKRPHMSNTDVQDYN